MIRYELKKDWMKKIQDGICPESIHPVTGRAVFVYCNTITQTNITGKSGLKPKYSLEHGNFFPDIKEEIAPDVFQVEKGHTDQFSTYGDDMFPDYFQTPEEVLLFSKNEILELEKQLSETIINNDFKTNEGVNNETINIALAAWKNFTTRFEKALKENKIVTYEMAMEMQSQLNN